MELVNEFVVNKPVDETWPILTDLERIAPCMPGAQLTEIEGDLYRGFVKIKVGPIGAQFKGQAQFAERDDEHHRAVLKADGRDTKGNGNASALITAQLEAVSDTTTKVKVTTDLNITGKVAQFGRGVLPDISHKLITQFADNLNAMIDAPAAAPTPTADVPAEQPSASDTVAAKTAAPETAAPETTAPETTAPETATADAAGTGPTAVAATSTDDAGKSSTDPSRPTVRKINSEPVEPLNVGSILPSWMKTAVPGGIVALILFFLLRRKR